MKRINTFMSSKRGCIFTFAIIFISIFVINCLTIWAADDYAFFNNVWLNYGKFDIAHAFERSKVFYLTWTGRFLSTFVNYIFLYFPKLVFNIANSTVYTALIGIIYKIIKKEKSYNSYVIWGIYAFTWLFVPSIGQVMFWQIGSVIYLWTFFLVTILIAIYTDMMKSADIKKYGFLNIIGLSLLGLMAGNGFETNSIVLICFEFLSMLFVKFVRKEKLPKWSIIVFIFTLIGAFSNFLSPGNSVRMGVMGKDQSIINKIIYGAGCWFYNGIIRSKIFILIIILVLAYTLYVISKKKNIDKKLCIVFIANVVFINVLVFIIAYVISPSLGEYLVWFYTNYKEFWVLFGLLLVTFIIMGIITFCYRKAYFENTDKKLNYIVLIYVISALLGIAAYIMTPTAWPRSYMGMSLTLIIAILLVLTRVEGFSNLKKCIFTILILISVLVYGVTLIDCYRSTKWSVITEGKIQEQINNGVNEVYVNTYKSTCTRNAASIEKWVIPPLIDGSIPTDYEWINQSETNYYFKDSNAWASGKRIYSDPSEIIESKFRKLWIIEYFK